MRLANVHARSKMKARRPRIEEEDNTEFSETASQCWLTSEEWSEMEIEEAGTDDEWPSAFGVEIFDSRPQQCSEGNGGTSGQGGSVSEGIQERLKLAEKLTATLTTRDQLHVAELASNVEELEDCKAARSPELERRERLDADCTKLQCQLSVVEEHLITAKAKLLEMEATVQQLAGHTDAALCAKID
ncbi:hypothetical protein AXG93_2947s1040 [Marchantia polymorpha subsp. ruderalis]|uniref:Uncharacterized protein n=1 Tax=Marchantia polymorpha subsp. ruderalis TaxID=1480154 RepID=A0A176WQ05_MARPO|nr:hypothetical protein AXG93_2947s1040 [Marchantia polymorpha subsp. ruderalis]